MGNRIGNKIAVTVKLVDIGLDGIAGYLERTAVKYNPGARMSANL